MSSHNAKADFAFHKPSTKGARGTSVAPIQRVLPAIDAGLEVDEDFDLGCDPYNATGQHVIAKSAFSKDD